jgi:hypothetical protein
MDPLSTLAAPWFWAIAAAVAIPHAMQRWIRSVDAQRRQRTDAALRSARASAKDPEAANGVPFPEGGTSAPHAPKR